MNVIVLPTPLQITTTPAELRMLADLMEVKFKTTKLGESTLVDEWQGQRATIQWHFDQEKMEEAKFVLMRVHLFQKGDVVQHCGHAYEVTNMLYSERDQGYWVGVKGSPDPIFCSKNTSYMVKRDHVPPVS